MTNLSPLKMNADYESVLFYGRIAPQILNYSIEPFILFLEKRPLFSTKKYDQDFLEYVESMTHHRPEIVSESKNFENWWGEGKDFEVERVLNSKITSAEIIQNHKWCDRTFIIRTENDMNYVPMDRTYLVKNPFGMSGQRFLTINPEMPHHDLILSTKQWLKEGPVIVEPLLKRKHDFSAYVFADDHVIHYENMIDAHYQYKGSVFADYTCPNIQHLSFFHDIALDKWQKYNEQMNQIIKTYGSLMAINGYSVDSFTYIESDLEIRSLSEVNYRRTMGRVTYELAQRFNQGRPWAQLLMGKSARSDGGFKFVKDKLRDLLWSKDKDSGFIILSPGDTRFEILFLLASGYKEAEKFQKELILRFPSYNFAVKI